MSEAAVVRSVDWKSTFPGLTLLARAAGKSFHPLLIVLGTVGVMLTAAGWFTASAFLSVDAKNDGRSDLDREGRLRNSLARPDLPSDETELELRSRLRLPILGTVVAGPVETGFLNYWLPGRQLFFQYRPARHLAYLTFGLLWQLAVWALIGGILVRKTIVELATDEPHGVLAATEFAWRRFGFFFTAPLFPVFAVILMGLPFMLLGFFMRSEFGVFIAGLLWVLVILAGLAAAWLLVALMFGFPLLWGAVATEADGDHFGAISRMFAYVYQRPLHYLFYVLVLAILGGLANILVGSAIETAERFGPWAVSWGMSEERGREIEKDVVGPEPTLHDIRYRGTRMIRAVRSGLKTLGEGWGAVFFWCGFAGVYLAMRKAVDDREIDEVMLDDDTAPMPATVAPVARPAAGPPTATILPTEPLPPIAEAVTAVEVPPPVVSEEPPAPPPT